MSAAVVSDALEQGHVESHLHPEPTYDPNPLDQPEEDPAVDPNELDEEQA